jgi:Mlc titration factor MtfA (ptsG expression regulator)
MRLIPRRTGLPADGAATIERHLSAWQGLDETERRRLLEVTDHLLAGKRWEAARGFTLDSTVRTLIAAQAALLVLELDVEHYRLVSGIVVHASTVQMSGVRPGLVPGTVTDEPMPVLGLAQGGRGPVVLAWDQVVADAQPGARGHNVVLHEFAHKLDMLDGSVDGTPVLPAALRADWVRACTAVYQDLVRGVPRPPMRWYGATNPGEFFAVATEVFFELPHELREAEPALYDVLVRFYRQDPAARTPRPAPRVELAGQAVAAGEVQPGGAGF